MPRAPPPQARGSLGLHTIGGLAVDDEPTTFWDGADVASRVQAWKEAAEFVDGDEIGFWGHVRPAGNGTSGRLSSTGS